VAQSVNARRKMREVGSDFRDKCYEKLQYLHDQEATLLGDIMSFNQSVVHRVMRIIFDSAHLLDSIFSRGDVRYSLRVRQTRLDMNSVWFAWNRCALRRVGFGSCHTNRDHKICRINAAICA